MARSVRRAIMRRAFRSDPVPIAKIPAALATAVACLTLVTANHTTLARDPGSTPDEQQPSQHADTPPAAESISPDVDPLALRVLQAVTLPLQQARELSFRALISEESEATNGQLVTFFHTVDVTMRRPDELHVIFHRDGERTDFYETGDHITMYSPGTRLYTVLQARKSIDASLDYLNARHVDIPIGPFLRSDLYHLAAQRVQSGYVIGRVTVADQELHLLAFRTTDADYQLWVSGGAAPRFIRAETINKRLPGQPRTIVQFLDWNLAPTLTAQEFTFTQPPGAARVGFQPP